MGTMTIVSVDAALKDLTEKLDLTKEINTQLVSHLSACKSCHTTENGAAFYCDDAESLFAQRRAMEEYRWTRTIIQ